MISHGSKEICACALRARLVNVQSVEPLKLVQWDLLTDGVVPKVPLVGFDFCQGLYMLVQYMALAWYSTQKLQKRLSKQPHKAGKPYHSPFSGLVILDSCGPCLPQTKSVWGPGVCSLLGNYVLWTRSCRCSWAGPRRICVFMGWANHSNVDGFGYDRFQKIGYEGRDIDNFANCCRSSKGV